MILSVMTIVRTDSLPMLRGAYSPASTMSRTISAGGIVGRKARTLRRFLIVSMTSFIGVPLFLQDDNSSLG